MDRDQHVGTVTRAVSARGSQRAPGQSCWVRYRRKGLVRAEVLGEPRKWVTAQGTWVESSAGDWWVTDDTGAGRGVAARSFGQLHEPVTGATGVFRRRGVVRACQLESATVVQTEEGPVEAVAGNWLVDDGERRWPVPHDHFVASYEQV